MKNNVKLVSITTPILDEFKGMTGDELLAAIARVSNPNNQTNLDTMPKLLNHCISNKHWSVFEMADMTVEITTTRMIAAQILRHRSFVFQEFSQRYAKVSEYIPTTARRQDNKNRQNSIDDLNQSIKDEFIVAQKSVWDLSYSIYNDMINKGVAKECARAILPLNTATTMYMKGSVRNWIHYLEVRTDPSTQKEHRDIALQIKDIFVQTYPLVSQALKWSINTVHE
jgi:thymidylate synthase (FAD)